VALAAAAVAAARTVLAPSFDATGPDGAVLGKAALARLSFAVRGDAADLADQRWTLDGRDVTGGSRRAATSWSCARGRWPTAVTSSS